MWAHLFLVFVFLAVTVETVAICLSPSPHFFLYFFKCNFYIACKAGFKVREQWRKWEGRLKNKKEKKGTVQEARIISALWWILFLLALGIKTGVLKLNTKWKRLVRIVVVWGVGSCCSGFDTNQTGKILSWVNNISAEIYSTSSPKFHQLCFFLVVVCMLCLRHKGTRGRQTKRRSEGERKRRASRWDYVFMKVPRPIGEMGAVPGIFSRPPSMACPRLVKSGFHWMDTHTHGHTHTEGQFPGSADRVELESCWVTVALRHRGAALR